MSLKAYHGRVSIEKENYWPIFIMNGYDYDYFMILPVSSPHEIFNSLSYLQIKFWTSSHL